MAPRVKKPNTIVVEGVLNAPGYIFHDGDFKWCDSFHLEDYPKPSKPGDNISKDPRYKLQWTGDFLGKETGFVVYDIQPGEYTDTLTFSWDSLCYGSGAAREHMYAPSTIRWGGVAKRGTVRMATYEEVETYYGHLRQAVACHLMELSYGTPGPACGLPQRIDHPLIRWVKGYEDLRWSGQAGAMAGKMLTPCQGDKEWDARWWDDEHFTKMIFTGTMPTNYCPAHNVPPSWRTDQNREEAPYLLKVPCEGGVGYVRFLYELREKISSFYGGAGVTLELRPKGSCRFSHEGMGVATCIHSEHGWTISDKGPLVWIKAEPNLLKHLESTLS